MPIFLKNAYKRILENLNLLPFFKITSRKIECLLSGNFIEWHPLSDIHLLKPNEITHFWVDKAHLIPQEYQKIFSPHESYPFKIYLTFLSPNSDHWLTQNFFLSSPVPSGEEKKIHFKEDKKLNTSLLSTVRKLEKKGS